MIYYMTGSGTIYMDDTTYQYTANDVFFLKPGVMRTQYTEEPTNYICIRFQSNEDFSLFPSMIYSANSDQLFNDFKRILTESQQKHFEYFKLCNHRINEILIQLSRLVSTNIIGQSNIYEIIKEMDSSLQFNRSVQDMAADLNYNYDYFRHKFRRITGKSPMTYIIDKRIDHARELLQKNIYTCTEISNLCGFSSSAQFSKIFKREVGVSPLTYQKSLRDDK
ncbi:MAG: AraC family transcriptional regulator [Lachnospiraceae bacterium]